MALISDAPRLLVTGGSGFIGRHIVKVALKKGWKVTNLSIGYEEEPITEGVCTLCVDLTNRQELIDSLKEQSFDYVVNCAGFIDHSPFFKGGRNLIESHFNGLQNLLEAVNKTRLKRFIQIGSSDEYGNQPAPQKESERESPISPYSLAKTAATHLLQTLYKTESFPAVTLRLFLVYGPGQGDKRFLPQIIQNCLNGISFPVSEGKQLRDFCFIEDMVRAVFLALEHEPATGEVFNIASGQPVTIREMIETVKYLIGKGEPRYGAFPYRPGENMQLFADASKAEKLLGWKSEISIQEGLLRTIEYYKSITVCSL